jgi:hypothetical protein
MKAIVVVGETRIEIAEQPEGDESRYVVNGDISPQLKSAVEQEVLIADQAYDSPAYGSRLGWVASSVAESLKGTFVVEDEPPDEPGVVY